MSQFSIRKLSDRRADVGRFDVRECAVGVGAKCVVVVAETTVQILNFYVQEVGIFGAIGLFGR